MSELLQPQEIDRIEREWPRGLPAPAIVEIFRPYGVRLSEATFRKYVQAGLLPRSRRVGRKGKHRGSQGLYPVEVVRRINLIKKMMADGQTLEEIRESFVFYKNGIDQTGREVAEVLGGLRQAISERPFSKPARQELERELRRLERRAEVLIDDLTRLSSAVTARHRTAESTVLRFKGGYS